MEIATNKDAVLNEMMQLKAAGYDYQEQLGDIKKRIAQLQLLLNLFDQAEKRTAEQKAEEAAKPAEAATTAAPKEPAK